MLILVGLFVPLQPALAQSSAKEICEGSLGVWNGTECTNPKENSTLEARFGNIVNALIFIVGAIAVLMLIIAAIRFATSAGDAEAAKGARNTILYAIIAIVVAILAYAIINFVIKGVSQTPASLDKPDLRLSISLGIIAHR